MNQIFGNALLISLFISAMSAVTSVAGIAAEVPGTKTPQSPNPEIQPSNAKIAAAVTTPEALTSIGTPSNTKSLTTQPTSATLLAQNISQAEPTQRLAEVTSVSQLSNVKSPNQLAQVTSVSQLSDVQPTDWAFQALQSLVERYGCIVGYPDSTYRGNRALTRYEFAAGLNSCLDRINELIAAATTDLVRREDLATLQRLQEEFGAELATLRGRVDALEAATAELEANQFSTTTKLNGEVVIALSDTFGGGLEADGNEFGFDAEDNTVFQGRARLNFDTSFTGEDQLRVRLQAGNFNALSYSGNITNEAGLAFATDTGNQFQIGDLFYQFPLGNNIVVHALVVGGEYDDFINVVDPLLTATGTGAITNFSFNPIYNQGGQGAGLAVDLKFTDQLALNLGYQSGEANNPIEGAGIANGDNSYLARLEFVNQQFQLAAVYVHSYTGADSTWNTNEAGSTRSLVDVGRPTVANSYGVEASFAPFSGIRIGAWGGYSNVTVLGTGRADVWNYAATLTFPDFGKEGNLLGFIVGQEPKLTGTTGFTVDGRRGDPDLGLHVEGFYRYQLTDNISITPGVVWLTNPNHNEANDDIIVGTIRTTFQF